MGGHLALMEGNTNINRTLLRRMERKGPRDRRITIVKIVDYCSDMIGLNGVLCSVPQMGSAEMSMKLTTPVSTKI
jgi:hypothetical protein